MASIHTNTNPPAKRLKSSLPTIRIGGVPEHFNYPLHMVKQKGLDAKYGVNLVFAEHACGTGQMISTLKEKSVDLIVALTEGITADIAKGSDVRILGTYVSSPLCWVISGAGDNNASTNTGSTTGTSKSTSSTTSDADTSVTPPNSVADMKGKTFGISRYGSGSQLMAYVLANERGWDPQKDVHFKVIGNFQNLRDSVSQNTTQAFMWETFTTKPYHDSGECSRLGDISTPWPCFMVAGLNDVVNAKLDPIRNALAAIHEASTLFHEAKDTMPLEISANYSLQLTDAQAWYSGVSITAHRYVSATALERALEALVTAGVLSSDLSITPKELLHPDVAELMPMDIKKVRLYKGSHNLIRLLHQGLRKAGLGNAGSSGSGTTDQKKMDVESLAPFDQRHHYGGIPAVQEAIQLCGLGSNNNNSTNSTNSSSNSSSSGPRVINIGSGLGGPARYIASTVPDSEVLAIELQHDLHSTAQAITSQCHLPNGVLMNSNSDRNNVTHMAGDFNEVESYLTKNDYDAIVSWLTVLHFPNHIRSFTACYNLLKPGGRMYIADLCRIQNLTVKERNDMRNELYCHELASSDELVAELESVGFRTTSVDMKTEEWTQVVVDRVANWEKNKESLVDDLGEESYKELHTFYGMIKAMFVNGNVGGAVIVVTKPKGW